MYDVERVFNRLEPLRRIGLLAATLHERIDASGYHRGMRRRDDERASSPLPAFHDDATATAPSRAEPRGRRARGAGRGRPGNARSQRRRCRARRRRPRGRAATRRWPGRTAAEPAAGGTCDPFSTLNRSRAQPSTAVPMPEGVHLRHRHRLTATGAARRQSWLVLRRPSDRRVRYPTVTRQAVPARHRSPREGTSSRLLGRIPCQRISRCADTPLTGEALPDERKGPLTWTFSSGGGGI